MKVVDEAHLSTWLNCVGSSTLEPDLSDHLAGTLDLRFGGVGLQSLARVADEELLGSWASVTPNLISFFRSKEMRV